MAVQLPEGSAREQGKTRVERPLKAGHSGAAGRGVEVAYFDIFDTLITRAVGDPSALFLLLGNNLRNRRLIPCTAEVYARQRAYAEKRAWAIA